MDGYRICRECNSEKKITSFKVFRKNQRRLMCNTCYRKQDLKNNPERVAKENKKIKQKEKEQRHLGINIEKWILEDSRKSDKKKNMENDLSKEFIEDQIANGCYYCGEMNLRMTLDRIDNTKGHLQANVKPACIRCNYARGAMPYEAWLLIIDGMRKARELGLFGNWNGKYAPIV
jgi:hypothetical protein